MQGRILGFESSKGVIRAENGTRYEFHINELKNAKDVPLQALSQALVDFELSDGKAVGIFVLDFAQNAANSHFNS